MYSFGDRSYWFFYIRPHVVHSRPIMYTSEYSELNTRERDSLLRHSLTSQFECLWHLCPTPSLISDLCTRAVHTAKPRPNAPGDGQTYQEVRSKSPNPLQSAAGLYSTLILLFSNTRVSKQHQWLLLPRACRRKDLIHIYSIPQAHHHLSTSSCRESGCAGPLALQLESGEAKLQTPADSRPGLTGFDRRFWSSSDPTILSLS